MMTFEQLLLGKVAEEACEVAQRALKAQQFGLDEIQEGQPYDNAYRLKNEVVDLSVVIDMLEKHADVDLSKFTLSDYEAKRLKVMKFADLSRELDRLVKE